MKPEQLKMARHALGLTLREFAEISSVSFMTVHRLEAGKGGVSHAQVEAMRTTLEDRGVQFLEMGRLSNGTGVAITANHA